MDLEHELKEQIGNFGRVEWSDNSINNSEPYKAIDYQEADKDHINFDKSLQFQESKFSKKHDISLRMPLKLDVSNICKNMSSVRSSFSTGNVEHALEDKESELETKSCKNVGSKSVEESTQNESLGEHDSSVEECTKDHCDSQENVKELPMDRKSQDFTSVDKNEQPVQIRQWLQQILVETETEPVVHEIGHFSGLVLSEIGPNLSLET